MSNVIDNETGKGRSIGARVWIWLLVASLLVFAGNTIYAMTKASRLGGASTAASSLQVNSQRLANQGREAVDGDADAYAAFKATKEAIDTDVQQLVRDFGNTPDVAGEIRAVAATWEPLAASADQVVASEAAVVAFAGNAGR